MKVPYGFSVHGQEERDAAAAVAGEALGEKTREFERRIATLFGKKHGIMVNSGSSANLLALAMLNLPHGSEVVTPALTFSTVVAPILHLGLVPVFVDVDPATFVVNIDQVEQAISDKTKALMIPSLIGNIPNLERLQEIAHKYGLYFIEDSCDTLGGTYKGKPSGTYSHVTTTSFYGSHIINAGGGGGMVLVDDDKLANRLIVLRGWGRESSLYGRDDSELVKNRFRGAIDGIPYDSKFMFTEIGYNFLPLEMSAAFGLVQLEKLPRFLELRKKYFQMLYEFFRNRQEHFILPEQTPETETAWLAYPVLLKGSAPLYRTDMQMFLEERGIQTRPIFTGNIMRQPAFKNMPHRRACRVYPNADLVTANGMLVGCHHGLNEEQMEYLLEQFRNLFSEYNLR